MARSYRARALAVMRQNEAAMAALYTGLARDVAGIVQRRADADGNVPRQATFEIQQQAGDLVRRLFLGRNGRGEWAPFDTVGNGAVIPLSPYMRQLWGAIRAATRIPVEQSAAILERRLPLDVLAVMRSADVNPFAAAKVMVAEFKDEVGRMKDEGTQGVPVAVSGFTSSFILHPSSFVSEQIFRPNPLAAYDAPHTWVDPNGYRLSDRVWNTAGNTRQRLDAYLETAIREGRGALQMSRELEQFLIPGRGLRTSKPYGASASFDGMRLARTEISRAAQEAHRMAATMNPFVRGMKWNLSARHPKIDICDDLARGGPNGDGVYSVEEYPERPHPQCLCWPTNQMIENPDAVLDELRADIRRVRADLVDKIGPLLVEQFEKLLLGQGLEVVSMGPVGRVIAPGVVAPPIAVAPVVTPPPPPPPPVNRAAEARDAVLAVDRQYQAQLDALEEQVLTVATELTETTRHIDRLGESLIKRQGTPQTEQIRAKLAERRLDRERLLQQRRELQAQQERVTAARAPAARRLVQVANTGQRPAQVSLRTEPAVDAIARRNWQRGTDEFNALVSADVAPAQAVPIEEMVGRAHYDPRLRLIRAEAGDEEWVLVHELGHWLEDHNPEVHRRAVEFYERRTQGYPLEWMGPGYDRNELTKKDKFIDAYMGVDYSIGSNRYATEIVSKGLELLYRDPARLAKGDPEMFEFIYNLARGLEVDGAAPVARVIVAPSRVSVGRLAGKGPMVLSSPVAPPVASIDDLRGQLDDVFRDYRAAKTAGDSARMSLLRTEAERLKNQIELLEQQQAAAAALLSQQLEPGSAAAARAALAEAEASWLTYQDELTNAYTEYNRFAPAIKAAIDNRDDDAFDALVAQRQPLKERLERLRANPPAHPRTLVYVEQASNTRLATEGAIPTAWQEGINEFNRLVSSTVWRDQTIRAHGNLGVGSAREYAVMSGKEVFLNPLTPSRTVVHELAHILESDPETLRKVLAFYDARTAGDVLEPLQNFSATFHASEMTRRDRWVDPYIGKDYNRQATEVISMGLEWMYERPIELARRDPEMFDFIFNLLRGR